MAEIATWPESPSLLMVTHHVEEILPCLTHVLLLKDGQVHSQGEKEDILTSESLTQIYGAPSNSKNAATAMPWSWGEF